jgi:hypothetical protein
MCGRNVVMRFCPSPVWVTVKLEMCYHSKEKQRELHSATGDVHELTYSEKTVLKSKPCNLFLSFTNSCSNS